MNKILYKFLLNFISKEAKLNLEKTSFKAEKDTIRLEAERAEARMRNRWYAKFDLTEVENNLIKKRLELDAISDLINSRKAEVENKITKVEAQLKAQELINYAQTKTITALETIISNLTKQVGSKVEIVR